MLYLQTRHVTDPSISPPPPPPLPPTAPSSSGRSGEELLDRNHQWGLLYVIRVSYSSQPTCNLGPGDFLLASGSLTGKPEYSAGPGYVLLKWCVIIHKICLSSVLRTNINRFWFKCHPLFLWLISLNPLFPRLRLYIWRFCSTISFWNYYQFPATDFPGGQLSLSTANLFFHLQLLSEYEA